MVFWYYAVFRMCRMRYKISKIKCKIVGRKRTDFLRNRTFTKGPWHTPERMVLIQIDLTARHCHFKKGELYKKVHLSITMAWTLHCNWLDTGRRLESQPRKFSPTNVILFLNSFWYYPCFIYILELVLRDLDEESGIFLSCIKVVLCKLGTACKVGQTVLVLKNALPEVMPFASW